MKSKMISEVLKRIPLETRFKVLNEIAFIDLLSELGYRDGYWKDEEDEKLQKLCNLAEKIAKEQMKEIEEWEKDGKPK